MTDKTLSVIRHPSSVTRAGDDVDLPERNGSPSVEGGHVIDIARSQRFARGLPGLKKDRLWLIISAKRCK